jgi:hypothetical protein
MKLTLLRFSDDKKDSTIGLLYIDNLFSGFILEDIHRDVKVKGVTRIQAGIYDLVEREVLSPSAEKYRKRFPWFKWHIMLKDVPEFKYIYIHPGVHSRHTDGCLLTGMAIHTEKDGARYVAHSSLAYEKIYKKVIPEIRTNGAKIEIIDEKTLKEKMNVV